MPLTVEEYQIAQLYSVAEMSKQESSADSGIQILTNEPYDNPALGTGQYTHKLYHLGRLVSALMPSSALIVDEKAWNAYPDCLTGERFSIKIQTKHVADDDNIENIHNLPPDLLSKREVIIIDISNDPIDPKEAITGANPKLFSPQKDSARGPLGPNWIQETKTQKKPFMCCYKLITIKFKVFGLESKIESYISKYEQSLFLRFHRTIFCSFDKWFGLAMSDIRMLEEEAKRDLDKLKSGLPTATGIDRNAREVVDLSGIESNAIAMVVKETADELGNVGSDKTGIA